MATPDGADLVVHDFGGRGRPVLLAHAAGLHGMVWEQVAAALGPAFRCVAVDWRGHGGSRAPAGWDGDWDDLATDALAVVDALRPEAPFGLGHSTGATALLLAEQRRPGTFARLYCYEPVLVAADPPLGPDPESWLAAAARRRRDVFESPAAAARHLAAKPPFSGVAPAALAAYVAHGVDDLPNGTVRLACRPETEAARYEMATAHDCYAGLGRVGCPTLVVVGGGGGDDHEARHRAELAATTVARLPEGRIEAHPDLGHLGPLEDPAAVAASARRWFLP